MSGKCGSNAACFGDYGYRHARHERLRDLSQFARYGKNMPVIFLSVCDSLDDRLAAFDAGGDGFLSKPADSQVLLRKVKLLMQAKAVRDQLASEKDSFESMAMTVLDSMGESDVLQNYTRANFECPEYASLLENILQTTQHLGLECHIQFRTPFGSISCTHGGQKTSPLEESILMQIATMGRLFQFKKRLVTNFERITILIVNMPESAELAGRIRDNIAILAEIADAFDKLISLRQESKASAARINKANQTAGAAIEVLRDQYRFQQVETRMLQLDLIERVEKHIFILGLLILRNDWSVMCCINVQRKYFSYLNKAKFWKNNTHFFERAEI